MLVAALRSKKDYRIFLIVLCVTNLYYTVGGYWYWKYIKNSEFVGVFWGGDLDRAAIYLSLASTLVFFTTITFSKKRTTALIYSHPSHRSHGLKYFHIFSFFGVLGAGYVFASLISYGNLNLGDPFILIAYQFSDFLIPCILFRISYYGMNRKSVIILMLFSYYAVSVGLRYKLLLTLMPIFIFYVFYFDVGLRSRLHKTFAIFGAIVVLFLFSLMTTGRPKFNSLDLSNTELSSFDDFLYGFFAETNLLFGLITAIRSFVDNQDPAYIYLSPIGDFFLELLPKFLFPFRQTNAHYSFIADGLITDEGANSGTTYPFVGEYLVMFGFIGLVVGCVFYSLLFLYINRRLIRLSRDNVRMKQFGVALLATFFGYYFYSRGYLPQTLKGLLFVIFPYLLMVGNFKVNMIRKVV